MSKTDLETNEEILKELRGIKRSLDKQYESFKRRFLLSIVSGFGAVIGATIMVSVFILILQQVASFDILKPTVERIIEVVDQSKSN